MAQAPKLKIAGQHEVTEIKRDAAQVGCTRVTRAEVEQLLKEMDSAPQSFPELTIESVNNAYDFIRLTLRRDTPGFAHGSEDADSKYSATAAFDIRALHLCLHRAKAQQLFEFLGGALGYYSFRTNPGNVEIKLMNF